jgi:hypothetical protein
MVKQLLLLEADFGVMTRIRLALPGDRMLRRRHVRESVRTS